MALNTREGRPVSENELCNTMLHEIEHSLGMDGTHSTNPLDVLFRSNLYYGELRKHLSDRDIRTVRALYALPPKITNPPGINLVRYSQVFSQIEAGVPLYNQQNFAEAYTYFHNALMMYEQDTNANYFAGLSAWNLNRPDEALPLLMRVVNDAQSIHRVNATKTVGYILIRTATEKVKAGQLDEAELGYRKAQHYVSQTIQKIPLDEESRKLMNEQLNWLIQAQTTLQTNRSNAANMISAGSGTTASSHPGQKKGFFAKLFDYDGMYTSQVPVYIKIPSRMSGF